jgi:protein gp37
MAENTAIEWADHTFNPWVGCTKVSPGCDHCYAEGWAKRAGKAAGVEWGGERRRTSDDNWRKPLQWNAQAEREGRRFRVFCASLADVFDNAVPEGWRLDLFDLIRRTPHLDWLLLTKRIGNVRYQVALALHVAQQQLSRMQCEQGLANWLSAWVDGEPPPNVWLGATVVNQAEADRDIPKLLRVPAAVRFLSVEPMLGQIDLRRTGDILCRCEGCIRMALQHPDIPGLRRIDWVIVGGESGPGARPMHPEWARSLRDQCAAAGVPFLFKQWGEWLPISEQTDEFNYALYRSNRVAKPHESQGALDELYGRSCTVPQCVIQADGTAVEFLAPMAFQQGKGSMQTFRVGKKAAGRQLDGRTHDAFPHGLTAYTSPAKEQR